MKYLSFVAFMLSIVAPCAASMPEVTEAEAKSNSQPAPAADTENKATTTENAGDKKDTTKEGSKKKINCTIL